jgi:YVTN family beta-propeller protein
MTTRRQFLAIAGGVAGFVGAGGVAAAGVLAANETKVRPRENRSGVPDVLLADTASGLATVRGTGCRILGPAVHTPDAATIHAATPVGDNTSLESIDTATGRVTSRVALPGRWVPRIASTGGVVALTATDGAATAYRPVGRERTTIVIADRTGEKRRLELPGNYEPDAFTAGDDGLFVLDWLPPTAPDRYRVRLVDLATGAPGPLGTRLKTAVPEGAEEEMRGEGRQAVYSPDAATLYTLYTHQPDHQHTRDLLSGGRRSEVHAFVHTLNLRDGWAYCLDLPEPFGHGPAAAHTLAVGADGKRLYVADLTSGRLAVADTESLSVQRVVPVPTGAGPACAAVSPDGRWLLLGGDSRVHVVDPVALTVATWIAGGHVQGLAVSRDSARVYVGHPGAVSWHEPATGVGLGMLPVAGLTELRRTLP